MRSYYKDKSFYGDHMSYEGRYLLDPKYMTKRDLRYYYRYYNMAKNRGRFKKVVAAIFCICFFSYLLMDLNLKTTLLHLRDRFDFIPRVDYTHNLSTPYFVNTPGCRMPYFPITDENIMQFMFHPEEIKCRKPLTRTSDVGSTLLCNMNQQEMRELYNITDLDRVRCYYSEFKRVSDMLCKFFQKVPFKLKPNCSVQIPSRVEFMMVECSRENITFYLDYHFFVPNKLTDSKANKNDQKSLPKGSASATNESIDRVSVMVFGIDSVSHLNFLRQMTHSAAYIHDNLEHAEFWGYNKVGDNSYPNVVPMLSGLDVNELAISCLEPVKHQHFDRCNLLWKRYKENGFQTAFVEDTSKTGTFHYLAPGFKEQPTDYYMRPIIREMEKHVSGMSVANVDECLGGRRAVDTLFETIRKMMPYLQMQDFFSFFWTITFTHDYWNMPQLLDDDLVDMFELFDKSGIFNKTVIFLLSDHGLRWGSFRATYQGTVEDRQPLLIVIYPPWLRQKFPVAISNLEANTRQLTTPFDVYATMLDLLDLRNLKESELKKRSESIAEADTMPRGISLFVPIPPARNCDSAGIAAHWCLCYMRNEIPTNDARAQRAARFIIQLINKRLQAHPQCRVLYLNSILEAVILEPHQKISRNITKGYFSIDVSVRLETKPGMGLFETTVRMGHGTIALTGTISRLNLYGSQSFCIDRKELKMFCYCPR